VIAAEACVMEPTTVIDLTGDEAVVVRAGRGDAAALGL
jgi:tRNA A37 threonylcarbamoyladenosine synthetase subunit TsaC/SUA5/YrdC